MSHALFDAIWALSSSKSNNDVAKYLDVEPACISRWRHKQPVPGPVTIRRICARTGWSDEHVRSLMADESPRTTLIQNKKKPTTRAKTAKPVKVKPIKVAKPPKQAKPVVIPALAAKHQRLTVTETPKWVSRVHRVM